MNEKNGYLVFFWYGADSRFTLSVDSQWFPHLVLTPSKAQVLIPRSYPFIFPLFSFILIVLHQFWYQSTGKNQKISPKKNLKLSLPCFPSDQTTIPTQKPTTIKETRSRKPITHSTRTVPQEFVNIDLTPSFQSHCPQPS